MKKMRGLLVFIAVLVLLLPSTYAACSGGSPDGTIDSGEECDDGNTNEGDGCSNTCLIENDATGAIFNLALGHNLLFSKVMDLLHIVKHMIIQLELKTVEISLTENNCTNQPVSFKIPAHIDPYGKLNEVGQMLNITVQSVNSVSDPATSFGISPASISSATSKYSTGISNINSANYIGALECFCAAYREDLLGVDTSGTTAC